MSHYFFNLSGSVQRTDTTGREVKNPFDLRREALAEAASAASAEAQRGEEAAVNVTVSDLTGAVRLKVRLISQVEGP